MNKNQWETFVDLPNGNVKTFSPQTQSIHFKNFSTRCAATSQSFG